MTSLELRVEQVVKALQLIGIHSSEARVLADGGNLIVHLSPYPIVARVMTLFEEDDSHYWRGVLEREIKVARHLENVGVPVVAPSYNLDPGPHPVGNTWCTLWEYIPATNLTTLSGDEAFKLLKSLGSGIKSYPGSLSTIGSVEPSL